jgi:hypothetical protein
VVAAAVACLAVTAVAGASSQSWVTVTDDFSAEPALFGLAHAPNGFLIAADAGAGPTEVRRNGTTSVIAGLPGVNDIAPLRKDEMFAVATAERSALYRVSPSDVKLLADTGKFEDDVDPAGDGTEEGSNPFDLASISGKSTLIADAAGNSLLIYENGKLDWVASFPFKFGVPCPAWFCEGTVPFPVQPVPTSVAIGPDGAYYVGELTGFPGTPGQSLVWRIEPGARNVVCGSSPKCTVVGRGFTSVIDLQFGPKNKLYVVELDEASWFAIEPDSPIPPLGGTINECALGASLSCTTRASSLPIVTAIAFEGRKLYATLFALVPGQAQVARIP